MGNKFDGTLFFILHSQMPCPGGGGDPWSRAVME